MPGNHPVRTSGFVPRFLPPASGRPVCGPGEEPMKPSEIMSLMKDKKLQFVDLKFVDFLGIWQHFTIPIGELSEDIFDEGLGFDGSSIRGWKSIDSSDMLVIP